MTASRAAAHDRPVIHVGRMLTEGARLHPQRPALVDGLTGASTTYADLDRLAASFAGHLTRHVAPGDRVVLCADSSIPSVAAFFALVHAGAVVVPVPTAASASELAFRAEHAGARLVLVDGHTALLAERTAVPVLRLEELPTAGEPLRLVGAPEGRAIVLYTSGTTGSSKGAVIGHASLVAHTSALVHHTLLLEAADVVLGVLPLAHSYGIRMAVLAPFFAGARTVVVGRAALGGRFDAERTLALAADHGVTWLPGVPTMFSAWGRCGGDPWPALRWALSAGAPLSAAVRERAERRLGAPVREGYGLTEATFTAIDAPGSAVPSVPGSVGRPVWGVEVRVVDPDDRTSAPLAPGLRGEVQVRGQNVMAGYLDDPASTAAAFDAGWLRTGDLGILDDEGRLTLVDRIKDLILRGAVNVVPAQVEAALARLPGVLEVAVVGRPDEHLGEEVVAVVVTGPAFDTDAFAAAAFEALGSAHAPRELCRVDQLPLGPSGKVLRRRLRDRLERGALVAERLRPVRSPAG